MGICHPWTLADTIEQARKVLAQAGGNDDEARMLISVGHIASRRLDAARGNKGS